MMCVRTFNWCKRRSEIVQVMEEDLVTVGARRNAGNVAVGFTAYPFRRVGLLEQLKHKHQRPMIRQRDFNIYLNPVKGKKPTVVYSTLNESVMHQCL